MIPAVILSSGRSTRMGRAKALLTLPPDNTTFLARIVDSVLAGGAADALIVGRPDDRPLREAVDDLIRTSAHVRFVENRRADTGQLSSVIAGVNAADRPGVEAILVTPVDLPLVTPRTVSMLITAFASADAPIVRATYHGCHGHPVIFGRSLFGALRRADLAVGAKAVVRAHAVLDVEVNDPGVLQDIDTPDEYARLLNREP